MIFKCNRLSYIQNIYSMREKLLIVRKNIFKWVFSLMYFQYTAGERL